MPEMHIELKIDKNNRQDSDIREYDRIKRREIRKMNEEKIGDVGFNNCRYGFQQANIEPRLMYNKRTVGCSIRGSGNSVVLKEGNRQREDKKMSYRAV